MSRTLPQMITVGAKRFWHVEDERGAKLVPVVSGGSDLLPPAPPAPPAAPPPPPPVDVLQVPVPPPAPPSGERTFTAAEVEAIREQEKAKLYNRLEEEKAAREQLDQRLRAFETGAQEQQAREAAAAAAEAERLRLEAESQLSAAEQFRLEKDRLDAAWREKEAALERERAILQRERELTALEAYRMQRVAEVAGTIEPNLVDLVSGNTAEEIEASIASLQERTARIVQAVVDAQEGSRRLVPMASPTLGPVTGAPPVGPVDGQSTYQNVSAEDIYEMDMETYRANRQRLLSAASQRVRQQGPYNR